MEYILILLGITCAGLLWAIYILWKKVKEDKLAFEVMNRELYARIENLETSLVSTRKEIYKKLEIVNCKNCKNFRELNGKPFCRVIGGVRETYINIERTEGSCYRFIEK